MHKGIGIGSTMTGLAEAGMVDMAAIAGGETFDMGNFDAGSFASMNVAEMGMSASMMAGALDALPVGAATAALETMAANPDIMGDMGDMMTGAITATMSAKGMGAEMMSSMGATIGIEGYGLEWQKVCKAWLEWKKWVKLWPKWVWKIWQKV